MKEIAQKIELCLTFFVFMLPFLVAAFYGCTILWKRIQRSNVVDAAICLFFGSIAFYVGATKHVTGKVVVDAEYLADNGSYLTNDVCYIDFTLRSQAIPQTTEALAYYREVGSTNELDWVEFSPRLTVADYPYYYVLLDATNYNVAVFLNFIPEPTVHTNGVWTMRGFTIPGTGKAAFPNSKIKR